MFWPLEFGDHKEMSWFVPVDPRPIIFDQPSATKQAKQLMAHAKQCIENRWFDAARLRQTNIKQTFASIVWRQPNHSCTIADSAAQVWMCFYSVDMVFSVVHLTATTSTNQWNPRHLREPQSFLPMASKVILAIEKGNRSLGCPSF